MTAATDFHWPVRVYYEDTDAGGLVYHANYLKFMERARTEWLRELGYGQDRLRADCGVVLAVRRASLDLRRPARFDQSLEVTCRPQRLRRASVGFYQEVIRDGEVLVQGEVMIACMDPDRGVPAPVPEPVHRAMQTAIADTTEATG